MLLLRVPLQRISMAQGPRRIRKWQMERIVSWIRRQRRSGRILELLRESDLGHDSSSDGIFEGNGVETFVCKKAFIPAGENHIEAGTEQGPRTIFYCIGRNSIKLTVFRRPWLFERLDFPISKHYWHTLQRSVTAPKLLSRNLFITVIATKAKAKPTATLLSGIAHSGVPFPFPHLCYLL